MSAAALYVRVSSIRQASEGLSLPEQIARCRAFAEGKGWTVEERHVFTERGVSGAKAQRPALDALMRAVESGEVSAVVTFKLDRIGRNAAHNLALFERFDAANVELWSTDGRVHTDKFVRTIESAVSEREREAISERVRLTNPAKAARGSYHGSPKVYGYDFGPTGLVVNESEAATIRRIFREFIAGTPMRSIAKGLNADGLHGPTGAIWTQRRISEKLDRPLYAGFVREGQRGRHEAIIDSDTWGKAQDLRNAARERRGSKAGRHAGRHLLSGGLLRCECDSSMYPRTDSRSGRDVYRCRGKDERATDCDLPPLPRAEVDNAVRQWIASNVFSPGIAESELEEAAKVAADDASRESQAAGRDASKAEQRLRNGKRAMLDDDSPFTASEWRELRTELEQEISAARTREAEAKRIADSIRNPESNVRQAAEEIRRAAGSNKLEDLPAQRAAISRLFECFQVVTGPLEEPPEPTDPEMRELARRQTAEFDRDPAPPPVLTVKGRRVALVPMPRGDVAARLGGAWPPLDSLGGLRQSVRIGLASRLFGALALGAEETSPHRGLQYVRRTARGRRLGAAERAAEVGHPLGAAGRSRARVNAGTSVGRMAHRHRRCPGWDGRACGRSPARPGTARGAHGARFPRGPL